MKCRSLAFGFRAMSLVLVTCTASCISIEGQSPREIKNGLQELFLYKSAHAFSDASAAGPFDARERLRDEQRRYITGEYQRISDSLLEALRQHRGNLEKVFPDMPRTTVQPRISMPDGGNDAPVIGQDGQIYIDIRIARLMFRDSVLASMRSSARSGFSRSSTRGGECRNNAADAVLLRCFLGIKERIDGIEPQSVIGTLFDKRTRELDDDAPWFMAVELQRQSVDLATRYSGVLLFVTAHELGHVALGHLAARRAGRFLRAEEVRDAERHADDFAVTLMALATANLSMFDLDFFGMGGLARGYEVFFGSTYRNAGWSEGVGTHPPSAERLARARALHEQLREVQTDEMFRVLLNRAQ